MRSSPEFDQAVEEGRKGKIVVPICGRTANLSELPVEVFLEGRINTSFPLKNFITDECRKNLKDLFESVGYVFEDDEETKNREKMIGKILRNNAELHILINSYGGLLVDGAAVSNMVKSVLMGGGKTYTYGFENCQSVCGHLFQLGAERYTLKNTAFMVHSPWATSSEVPTAIEKLFYYAHRTDLLLKRRSDIKALKTTLLKKVKPEYKDEVERRFGNWWNRGEIELTGEELLKYGIVHATYTTSTELAGRFVSNVGEDYITKDYTEVLMASNLVR